MENFENTPQEEDFNILEKVYQYLGFWKWFVIGVILSVTVAHFYLRYTPNVYETSAKIKILDDKKGGMDLSEITSMFSGSSVNLDNEMEVLRSHRLLERVATDLNLTTSYYALGNIVNSELWGSKPFNIIWLAAKDSAKEISFEFSIELKDNGYKLISKDTLAETLFSYGQLNSVGGQRFMLVLDKSVDLDPNQRKFWVVRRPLASVVAELSGSLQLASIAKNSEVLSLSLSGENSAKSEAVLDTIIDKFNEDGINDRQLVSQRTIDFVNERFVYLSIELDSIESQKESYKQPHLHINR